MTEMKWLYMELYDDQHAYDYFVEMLRRTYEKRSRTLQEWDDFRTIMDDWYRGGELLGYMVYTEQFAGDLEGMESHLEYLRELGVNYLHLMPLLESPEGKSDGGYAVSDFPESSAVPGNHGGPGKPVRCLPPEGNLCLPGFRHESYQ